MRIRITPFGDGTYKAEYEKMPFINGYGKTVEDAVRSAKTEKLMYEDYQEPYTRGRPCDEEGVLLFYDTDE